MSFVIETLKYISRLGKADFFEFSKYLYANCSKQVEHPELADITLTGPGFTANLNISCPDYTIDIFDQGMGYTMYYDRMTKKLLTIEKNTPELELKGLLRCSEGIFTLCPHDNWCKCHSTARCREDALKFAGLYLEGDH